MPTIVEIMAVALSHHESGRLEEAERMYREILESDSNNVGAWHLLGRLAQQARKFDVARHCIGRALELQPFYAEAASDLGTVFSEEGKFDLATECHRRAVALKPHYAEAHYNLGTCLQSQRRWEEAIECHHRALELKPDFWRAYYNLGMALEGQGNREDAIDCYRRALEIEPTYSDSHEGLGRVLWQNGELREAALCFRRAIEIKPDHADAHWNQSALMLLMGDFKNGWREFEWRQRRRDSPGRRFQQPLWDGGDLTGKTVLLHAEQGLGDAIQFVRYARLVKVRGARVVLECQPALVRLLSGLPVDQVVARGGELPAFDVHAPLMSLPRIFETRLESIPADVPYLFAEAQLVESWRERMKEIEAVPERHGGRSLQVGWRERMKEIDALPERHGGRSLQVAIAWQGNPENSNDRERSFRLAEFAALANVPGVRLISLQKGAGVEQLADVPFPVVDFGGDVDEAAGAFMDSAAIVMNVDLVITVDSALAHLAGALGVPVWVALPFVPDWRWMLERGDSPWYPTMRLFRQRRAGDWAGVFEALREALLELVNHERDE